MKSFQYCAILGHSPMRFSWGFDEEDFQCKKLKIQLLQQILLLKIYGVSYFMVACDPGVGLWSAEIVNILRACDSELQLLCFVPHEEQSTKWAPYLRERYFDMLEQCTHITAVHTHKTRTAQLDAYRAMIDYANVIIAVYDPTSARGDDVDKAIAYAINQHKQIIYIHPDTTEVRVK